MRIIIILPLSIENRFQGSLRRVFSLGAEQYDIEPVFVDSGYRSYASGNDFTDIYMHLYHDAEVIKQMTSLIRDWDGEIVPVFWYDVFFTGSLGGAIPVLTMIAERMGKRLLNIGYIHGGVWCNRDIYHEARYPVYVGMRDISYMLNMERVYTGSRHHLKQIVDYAKRVTKEYYASILKNILMVNPLPHLVRVGDYSDKDIDVFLPHSRYQCCRDRLELMIRELEDRGYKVYIADRYLGDEYIDYLARSKITIICKDQETYGVAETEAIYNYSLPYCPFDCESWKVMTDVHRDLYSGIFSKINTNIEDILDHYDDIVSRHLFLYIHRNQKDNRRWIGNSTLIHNTRFFEQLKKDVSEWIDLWSTH